MQQLETRRPSSSQSTARILAAWEFTTPSAGGADAADDGGVLRTVAGESEDDGQELDARQHGTGASASRASHHSSCWVSWDLVPRRASKQRRRPLADFCRKSALPSLPSRWLCLEASVLRDEVFHAQHRHPPICHDCWTNGRTGPWCPDGCHTRKRSVIIAGKASYKPKSTKPLCMAPESGRLVIFYQRLVSALPLCEGLDFCDSPFD
ncbi:hypothetical protein CTRI78_v009563 [Colletotrichum trifolii]|uniref:Uncharacterized protein n=1 Tax=Colletotrichum trifolii TaxID=5466 RepID=A0A4R8QXN6_COLTR|nr:hypothetical protein CTRI78_v009563 [Colletotrichum trifolii]